MLDLTTENKALCFEDSTRKPLYIFLYYWQEDSNYLDGGYWQYYTTIDDAIVLESLEIDEGILEGNNFELGSFVVPSMKVQWQNNGIRYKDMIAVPVQQIGDEYIAYFDGIIIKEEISANGQIITAELTTLLSQKLDIDVLEYIKEYSGYDFYIMLRKALLKVGIDFDGTQTYYRFANIDTIISLNKNTLPKSLSVSTLLKQAGEFLGAHIVFAKEKRIVNIDEMKTYRPSARPNIDFIRFANIDTVTKSNIKTLPSGYKRVEYIQTDGTQYINTGYIPNSNTKIEMQFYNFAKYLDVSNPANPTLHTTALFGARTSQTTKSYSLFASVYKLNEFVFDVSNSRVAIDQTPLYKQKISAQLDRITINDKTTSISAIPFECEYPLYLFSVNTAGSFEERCALGKLYSFKIYENDILQRDMIPCVRISDNKLGLYDIINGNFYVDENGSDFIAPNPIETYTLPYYINLYTDKTNKVNFDQIRVLTETGDSQSGQRNYTFWWNDDVKTTYEIKNNIFFEALSTQNWQLFSNAVAEVGSYIADQNLYYADLQTVYPPFIDSGDYLIVKGKNSDFLPSGYIALENIEIDNRAVIIPSIVPNSNNIDISIDFMLLDKGEVKMISSEGNLSSQVLNISASENIVSCYLGQRNSNPTFTINYVPTGTKIQLNVKFENGTYVYNSILGSGTGKTLDDYIDTEAVLKLGNIETSSSAFRLFHFSFGQGGVQISDLYPCMRESDGAIGVYDIVQNEFNAVIGNPNPNYESGDIVVPVLSTTARGIHSMRADILCKSTNTNKN